MGQIPRFNVYGGDIYGEGSGSSETTKEEGNGNFVLYAHHIEKMAAKDAEIVSLEQSLEAQTKKFEDCPHKPNDSYGQPMACGCSYDNPNDVCAAHSPQVKALQEQIRQLREALQACRLQLLQSNNNSEYADEALNMASEALEATK